MNERHESSGNSEQIELTSMSELLVGEIGLATIAAAITDAVHHATGMRARELPVKIEGLLG